MTTGPNAERWSSGLEQSEVSLALRIILWTLMAAVPLLLGAIILLPSFSGRWLGLVATIYALSLVTLALNRLGQTQVACIFLIAAMWGTVTAASLTAGGIASLAPNHYAVVVLIAGLLFGSRAALLTALICLLTALGLVQLEIAGKEPFPLLPFSPMLRLLGLTLLLAFITGLQFLSSRTISLALRRSREEVGERKRVEALSKEAEEALRSSERRFSTAFNANPTSSMISTLDGRFLAVNDRFLLAAGYSREEVVGRTALELGLWPDPKSRTNVMSTLKEKGSVRDFEAQMLTKGGDRRVMLLSIEEIELDGQRCLLHSGQDITDRTVAEAALRTSEERLRALSARLQFAREEEGRRIAREIHDELGGALTGLKWDLEGIGRTLSGLEYITKLNSIQEKIPEMTTLIESTMTTVRRISSELRPAVLDDLGLIAAIEWQTQQFQARTGISSICEKSLDAVDLKPKGATAVFRIFQEILTNVLRHAQATSVRVQIRKEGTHFVLEVKDNGRGITSDDKSGTRSFGILGMKERALLVDGEVAITGAEGMGTSVVVRVPIVI